MTAGWARSGHGPWSEATFDHGPTALVVHRPGHPQERLPIELDRVIALDAIGPPRQGVQQVELGLDNGAVLHAVAPRSFWEGLTRSLLATVPHASAPAVTPLPAAPPPHRATPPPLPRRFTGTPPGAAAARTSPPPLPRQFTGTPPGAAAARTSPPPPHDPAAAPTPQPAAGSTPPPYRGVLPPAPGPTPPPTPPLFSPHTRPAASPPPYRGVTQPLFSPRAEPLFRPVPSDVEAEAPANRQAAAAHQPARRRRHPLRTLGLAALVLLTLCTGDLVVLRARLDQFPAELPAVDDGVRTWLLVGTDSRAAAAGLPRPETYGTTDQVPGERADVVLLVQEATDDQPARVLSVPRDLLVFRREHGVDRLALTLLDGPTGLATSICRSLGVPVDHIVTIRFDGIRDLIDRAGGIEVHNDEPVRDLHTGLDLSGGTSRLDGADALAWMRARHVEVQRDGVWMPDPSSDTGRQERQRGVLEQLSEAMVRRARNPLAAQQLAWTTAGSVRADEGTGPIDLVRLAATLRRATERTSLAHDLMPGRIPVATLRPEAQAQLDGLRSRVADGPPCPRAQVRSE